MMGRGRMMWVVYAPVVAAMAVCATAGCRGMRTAKDLDRIPVQSDLKITKAVLYQNGVGYFERRGVVHGNVLHLRIRHDQVMDVLKSLTVVDLRKGRAVTIALPAERSRLMQLSQLPPQVRTSGGLLAIASAFRGATARVETDGDTFTGRIVGVENIGTGEKPDWRLTLLRAGGKVSSHAIRKIRSVKVLEKTLTLGLSKSLDVALNKGKWKPVRLTIRLAGPSPHKLVVSYVIPMPTWKPAYRLVVGKEKGKVLLQGYSVVDNLSGEGWHRVALSLTAGTPLAFKYDLYTPRDVDRPDLTPRFRRMAEAPPPAIDATAPAGEKEKTAKPALRPPARRRYAPRGGRALSGLLRKARRSRRYHGPRTAMRGSTSAPSADWRRKRWEAKKREIRLKDMHRSYRTMVSGTRVGSLFRYDIQEPVTIPDRSSALVNIVNKVVNGNDVLYLRTGSGKVNPYRAVRFKNQSGYLLERGPVVIYRGGTFVGEALGGRVERNAVAFVPYAMEGRVLVHLRHASKDEGLKLIKILYGYITVETMSVTRYKYKVTNRTGEKLTLYVQRPRRTGWKVVSPKEITVEKNIYYAPIPLKARGVTEFTVKEVTPVRRVYTMYSWRARKALALYLKGADASQQIVGKLKKVMSLWNRIADLQQRMRTIKSSMEEHRRQMKDIRDNLKALGKRGNTDLRRKLERNLASVTRKRTKLSGQWVELNMKKGGLLRRLRVMIKMIKFKVK